MTPKVYIETSVVSYYTGRGNRDVVIAGRQQCTQEFWSLLGSELSPFVSAIVVKEAGKGDPALARGRLDAIGSFPVLQTTAEAEALRKRFLTGMAYRPNSPRTHCTSPSPP